MNFLHLILPNLFLLILRFIVIGTSSLDPLSHLSSTAVDVAVDVVVDVAVDVAGLIVLSALFSGVITWLGELIVLAMISPDSCR